MEQHRPRKKKELREKEAKKLTQSFFCLEKKLEGKKNAPT